MHVCWHDLIIFSLFPGEGLLHIDIVMMDQVESLDADFSQGAVFLWP
jgi:hypothetical protein